MVTTQQSNIFQMYHGGKRWSRIPSEIIGSAQGRYEGGPGIYFTNSYETARQYAKGSRVVHLIDIDRNFKDISDISVPLENVIEFVKNCGGMPRKNTIIEALKNNALRMKQNVIGLDILNNLVVNYESGSGKVGIRVANYFVENGGDASVYNKSGDESWLIVFNPSIIKKISVVNPSKINSDFQFMLPKI
jgi:hypothetical protein